MGGDFAPDEVVKGVATVSLESEIEVVLVGDSARIQALLDEGPYNPEIISVRHCTSSIGMAEDPHEALRAKRDASIAVAARMVADGEADALVTAGNTGAAVLCAAKNFKLIRGVRRAALASVYPRETELPGQDVFGLLLDVGATIRCEAAELAQFAVMGSAYARRVSKQPSPRVGLLNMGREEGKGGDVLVEAHRMLRELPSIHFVGNVEGNDVATGRADVVVAEGLLGNVVLKLLEGIGEAASHLAAQAAHDSWRVRLGMAMLAPGIEKVRDMTDFSTYGGAPILGFERLCIKAHGRSSARAVANAVKVAAKAVRDRIADEIAESVAGIR
ncbi:phosphate acyltransferase PlsX [bacterium]|nr:phosphate acyltransferase PlsX [bacterium]